MILGISPDKNVGYKALYECRENGHARANYATLILCVEYVELNPDVQKSIDLIKSLIIKLKGSPIAYWMAALFNWRYCRVNFIIFIFIY